MDIRNMKVIIIGSGASGLAAAKLAISKNAKVTIYDQKLESEHTLEDRKKLKELKKLGVTMLLGVNMKEYIGNYSLIIKSPGVPMDLEFISYAKAKGIDVIGEFEFASRYCRAFTVAITGTNGKTTTTSLVGSITKAYIEHTHIVGNIGRPFSEEVEYIKPDDTVVAEVSSYQLESSVDFHPKISSVLNIEEDHLNRHGNMENYISIKENIFANQLASDFKVLNYDDIDCRSMDKKSKAKTIWFSRKDKSVPGTYIEDEYIVEHIYERPNRVCSIHDLKILGSHNVENALAAVAITSLMGIPLEVIKKQLTNFTGVAHRIEYLGQKKGIDFFNDSKATNPEAAIRGLEAMKGKTRVIVGGLDENNDFTKWVSLFPKNVSKAYVIGETRKKLIKTFENVGFCNYEEFESLKDAVTKAYDEASRKESIILSPGCASWDMFKSFEDRGNKFKEIFNGLKE